MSISRAALRYAKATLDLATEKKVADAVDADMRKVVHTLDENAELTAFLGSPVVKGADKRSALKAIFKGWHAVTEGLVDVLVSNNRIDQLGEVALKFIALYEERKGQSVAKVTTAVPLTETLEKKILQKVKTLTGKEVTLENEVDDSIVGGFILRLGDLQYDASISNQLSTIKREFTNSI